jgi:RNA-binding protein YlmH
MNSEIIPSRIKDAIRLCGSTSFPKFIGFLRFEEIAEAENVAKKLFCRYCFFGGYEGAERAFFGVFPDWCEETEEYFPIRALTLHFRKEDKLSHRHVLGTLMSQGITRESVGDILIEEGRAVVFLSEDIAEYVKTQTEKISGVGVKIVDGFSLPLPGMTGFESVTETVASARLDCVISALYGCSRNKAAELITSKMVARNGICSEKPTSVVAGGDTVNVKGKGKFKIESIDGRTKKDRLILKAKKYI